MLSLIVFISGLDSIQQSDATLVQSDLVLGVRGCLEGVSDYICSIRVWAYLLLSMHSCMHHVDLAYTLLICRVVVDCVHR